MPKVVKLVVIPLLLIVAVAAVLWVALDDSDGGGTPESVVVEELIPGEDTNVLRQSEVGIDLLAGWDASLVVNGERIPDDELDRIVELGRITYNPGPEQSVESLLVGRNCVSATYWAVPTPEETFTRSWCFQAG